MSREQAHLLAGTICLHGKGRGPLGVFWLLDPLGGIPSDPIFSDDSGQLGFTFTGLGLSLPPVSL